MKRYRLSVVKEELEQKEKVYADYEEKKASLKQYAHELDTKKNDAEVNCQKLDRRIQLRFKQ